MAGSSHLRFLAPEARMTVTLVKQTPSNNATLLRRAYGRWPFGHVSSVPIKQNVHTLPFTIHRGNFWIWDLPGPGWGGWLAQKNVEIGKLGIGLGSHFWYLYVSVPIQIGPYRLWHTLRIRRKLYGEFRKCRIFDGNRRKLSELGFSVSEKVDGA